MAEKQLLTVEQVAERLQVHPKTVQAWIRKGDLVGVRLGTGRTSAWRVEQDQLQAFIERNRSTGASDEGA
jgi:excisionase family DNA binding protein